MMGVICCGYMTKKELITAIVEARPEEYKETVLHKMKKAELEEIHGRIYFGDSSIVADAHEAVELKKESVKANLEAYEKSLDSKMPTKLYAAWKNGKKVFEQLRKDIADKLRMQGFDVEEE